MNATSNRATFPATLGGVSALAVLPRPAIAQASRHRVDVHRHVSPPFYQDVVPASSWECALDVLKADGVGTWTSYGMKYPGDAAFAPVWTELDRRKAVVFTHPTDAACCVNPVPQMSETVIEFAADTTRAIGSIVFSGTSVRFPNIRFIFSHGGGSMPFVIDRFLSEGSSPKNAALPPHGVEYELRRFYYDTAFASRLKQWPPRRAISLRSSAIARWRCSAVRCPDAQPQARTA